MENKERVVQLVRQAKRQDAHAFAKLYEMVYPDLYKTAYYNLNSREDAENVVSDTVLDAYSCINKLRDEGAFRAWIFKILMNKISRYIKEYVARRNNEMSGSYEDIDSRTPSRDDSIKNAEDKTLVKQAFEILSEEEKQIVTMSIYGEYDSSEIAGIMNLNRNTVRSKYSRALAKMRNYLSGGGDIYGQQR